MTLRSKHRQNNHFQVIMTRYTMLRKKAERHAHRYPIACRLCEGKHPIRLCPVYRAKTPEERLREVLLGRFCGNCLSMTHRVQRCTSRDRCRRCHDKHHTTLHIDEEPVDRRPWSQQVASEEERDNVLSIYASDSGTDSRTRRPEIEEGEIIEPVAEANFPISTGGSETRTFRLPLAHKRRQHQRAPQRRGAETRSFRRRSIRKKATGQEGQRQRARQRCGAETRSLRPRSIRQRAIGQEGQRQRARQRCGAETSRQGKQRQRRGAETWTFRPRDTNNVASRRDERRGGLVTRPRQLPVAFRSGQVTLAAQGLRPFTAISPTAIVKIESRGRLHLVRALIDVCAPASIISASLMRELGLEESGFGHQRSCMIRLRGKHGQGARLAIHAAVVGNYVQLSPTASVDRSIAASYNNIRLADPNFFTSTPIRLVLGADAYPEIVLPGTLPTSFGPLVAQNSIFGWLLSGACRS
ncbi:uncharacterized protein LOC118746336 isoform X1 [Rhagoletis pomonella]|uniref:uncharacterized protein LOC118746336 isoform X1 n=1 Tax=Rhagoletis pomonella TaxID=28610 RepID=UPI001781A8A7|nr:uncharacterized protein LOC118746336 isoform X1 [Rhagoletis pomonella]